MGRSEREKVRVPTNYPTSLILLDESGSKTSGGKFFVMAAVKVRLPGKLQREITALRDRQGFHEEFKFSELTNSTRCVYYELIDTIGSSDACIHATVVDRDVYNPFPGKEQWEVHLDVASKLVAAATNQHELVSVVMDNLTTPTHVKIEDQLRTSVNRQLRNGSVVTAMSADSRSSDLLQVADLFASAIGFDRRRRAGAHGRRTPSNSSPKGSVAARLMTEFGRTDFDDGRDARLNVLTLRGAARNRRGLSLVNCSPA